MAETTTVFLSSTSSDLTAHREAVLFALARLRRWVEAMEYFGALPGVPVEECLASVRRSDIYIGVIGTRYGSRDAAGISITQREYQEACDSKKKILIYLIDQENHPVLPKDVDTGESAERLSDFRKLVSNHTYAKFSSPQDLAMKIAIDLARTLENPRHPNDRRVEQITEQLPALLATSGYGVTFDKRMTNFTGVFSKDEGGGLRFTDPELQEVVSCGILALNLSRGNFSVLDDTLTFDQRPWSLLITLLKHLGLPAAELSSAIAKCGDALKFRVLVKLAGELGSADCVDAICTSVVQRLPDLRKQLADLHGQPFTPIEHVIKTTLSCMPLAAIPVIRRHEEQAKSSKRWRQKQLFEAAVRSIESRPA